MDSYDPENQFGGSEYPIIQQQVVEYTAEDVKFLQAASEVVKLHEHEIDPAIKQIMNRLQYETAPHGGLPISRQFMQDHHMEGGVEFPELTVDPFKGDWLSHSQDNNNHNHNHNTVALVRDESFSSVLQNSNHLDDLEERNYLCKSCGMSFKRSSDLKRHEKIHLEVMPNICPQCNKGFARKDALKRHINTLTCKRNKEKLLKELNKHV